MVTPLVVLALVVGGCSDGGGEDAAEEATTTTGPFEPTLRIVPDQPADAAQLDALAELATARLVGAGAGRARTEVDGGAVLVDVGRSPLSDSTAAELLDAPGVVGFQPVLEVRPFDQCPDGGEDDLAPEVDDGGLTVACHLLGPPALDESGVERAEVADGSGGVSAVAVVLSEGEDGIESFNRAAGACVAREETCPQQQLAIVFDGRVVSAPTIQASSFERDEIQISGNLDEDGIRRLAGVLAGGRLPVPVTVEAA